MWIPGCYCSLKPCCFDLVRNTFSRQPATVKIFRAEFGDYLAPVMTLLQSYAPVMSLIKANHCLTFPISLSALKLI